MKALLDLFRKKPEPLHVRFDSDEERLQTLENITYLSSYIKALDARIEDLRGKSGSLAKTKVQSLYEHRAWLSVKLEEERLNLKIVENKLKNIF